MSPHWNPRRGDIVLLHFPFVDATTGQVATKMRPALVVSGGTIHTHTADVIVVAISSRPGSRTLPTDFEIRQGTPEHGASGLRTTSWIKTSNIMNIPRSAVHRYIGHLPQATHSLVDQCLKRALDLP
jgi:mRNA-degrading endonuclease toxin of MazEF toxin-antitoxin module